MEQSPIFSKGLTPNAKAALFVTAGLDVLSVLSLSYYLLFYVPAFDKMFADLGQLLPAPTRFVRGISRYWYLAIPVVSVVPFLHIFTMRFVIAASRGKGFLWLYGILGWLLWTGIIWGFVTFSLMMPLVNTIKNIQ